MESKLEILCDKSYLKGSTRPSQVGNVFTEHVCRVEARRGGMIGGSESRRGVRILLEW